MGRLTRILIPGLLLLSVYYAVFGGQFSVFDVHDARDEISGLSEELDQLRVENDSMRSWVESLESDPAVLERVAREEIGMIMPGERLYRFDDAETVNDAGGARDGSG
jgi:cell division protein FtsB